MSEIEQQGAAAADSIPTYVFEDDAKLDAAIAERVRVDNLDREPDPQPEVAPEPEPDYDHELFAKYGTNLQQLARIAEENPAATSGWQDSPATSPEEMTRRIGLLLQLNEGRQATSALQRAQSDAALADAQEVLDESDEDWERHEIANELARNAPERLPEFLETWSEFEPLEASQWVAGRQQREFAARQHVEQLATAMAMVRALADQAKRGEEVGAALSDSIARVTASLNERGKRELGGYFAAALQELAVSQELQTPEAARAATAMALQQARSIKEAERDAKTLTELDRRIHNQNVLNPNFEPFDESEVYVKNFNAQFNGDTYERIGHVAARAAGIPRGKPKWLENFDDYLDGKKAVIDFGK